MIQVANRGAEQRVFGYGAPSGYRRMPEFRHLSGLPSDLEVSLMPEENTLVFRARSDVAADAWLDGEDGPLTEAYHALTFLGIHDRSTEFFPDPNVFDRGSYGNPTPNCQTVMKNLKYEKDGKGKRQGPHFHYTTDIVRGVAYDLLVVSLENYSTSIQDVLSELGASTKTAPQDEAQSDVLVSEVQLVS